MNKLAQNWLNTKQIEQKITPETCRYASFKNHKTNRLKFVIWSRKQDMHIQRQNSIKIDINQIDSISNSSTDGWKLVAVKKKWKSYKIYLGSSVNMTDIGSNTRGTGNIVESKLRDKWVKLHQKRQWLPNPTGSTENGDFPFRDGFSGKGTGQQTVRGWGSGNGGTNGSENRGLHCWTLERRATKAMKKGFLWKWRDLLLLLQIVALWFWFYSQPQGV